MAKNQEIFRTKSSRLLFSSGETDDENTLESTVQQVPELTQAGGGITTVLDITPGSNGSVLKSLKVFGTTNDTIKVYVSTTNSSETPVALNILSPVVSNSNNTYELLKYLPSTKVGEDNYYMSLENTRLGIVISADATITALIEDY